MNIKNVKNLILICGLIAGTLSISTPWESANGYNVAGSASDKPVSKQPSSGKKTFLPRRPRVRFV